MTWPVWLSVTWGCRSLEGTDPPQDGTKRSLAPAAKLSRRMAASVKLLVSMVAFAYCLLARRNARKALVTGQLVVTVGWVTAEKASAPVSSSNWNWAVQVTALSKCRNVRPVTLVLTDTAAVQYRSSSTTSVGAQEYAGVNRPLCPRPGGAASGRIKSAESIGPCAAW